MGRSPCCSKEGLNRGAWTAHEDKILRDFISVHGEGRWRNLPKRAGLKRCGKSCRLRWLNYLRPDIKRGNITPDEEELIIRLHKLLGNRWSLIAGRLPGRTDNEIKNYWNTNLDSKLNNNVVRTKATKCSKVVIPPRPPSSRQMMSRSEVADPFRPVDVAADRDQTTELLNAYDNNTALSAGKDHDHDHDHQQPSSHADLLVDFNVGEICLSDLLNSDFSDMFDFSNNSVDRGLSPSSDQPFVFSDEILNDWTQRSAQETNVGNNLHSITSFLESSEEWLAE